MSPYDSPDKQSTPPASPQQQASFESLAALENHLRLQQSQLEFIAWLEATEKKAEIDRYTYRKIR